MTRAANMQALTNDIAAENPGVVIYGKGDAAHALTSSDHNEDDTPGVRTPQTDADTLKEHRAIDVMIGGAFTKEDADALVLRILSDPAALKRLDFIIWHGSIWERANGWRRRDRTVDPHNDHIHFSGLAADDANTAKWPAVYAVNSGKVFHMDQIVRVPDGKQYLVIDSGRSITWVGNPEHSAALQKVLGLPFVDVSDRQLVLAMEFLRTVPPLTQPTSTTTATITQEQLNQAIGANAAAIGIAVASHIKIV